MRIFRNEKSIVILSKWKIFTVLILMCFIIICTAAWKTVEFYSHEIKEIICVKSNNSFQSIVNEAIVDILDKNKYDFVDIAYNNGQVSTVNYNTADINSFKADVIKYVINKIKFDNMKVRIYLTDAFNNPFIINKGPYFDVSCRINNGINVECYSKFEEMGVNQTKNTIWFEVNAEIYSASKVIDTVNKYKYSVAVGETIIVGNVPESYTNVADNEQTKDTVLNLQ